MDTTIAGVRAREILDSRGNPTVEADVTLAGGASGRAAVPSGASTGAHEAAELRDGDAARYRGRGVRRAVAHAGGELREAVAGLDCVHVAVDDRSRYACAEALPDERGVTTAAFLDRAIARFAGLGVRVERVLTDNGGNYPRRLPRDGGGARGGAAAARPYRPRPTAGRGVHRDPAGRVGVPPRHDSNAERLAALSSS